MVKSQSFWDKVADKYAKSPIKDMASYETTMARTKAHLTAEDRVLEVGCGTGSTALLLAPSVKHITATDISANMIEIGRNKAADQKIDNAAFRQATLEEAFDDAPFDAILAYNFLHLLEDPQAGVKQIHALLKPGGRFISKTICLSEKKGFLRPMIWVMQLFGKAPYVGFFKIADLEGYISNEGFEIIETGDYPAAAPSHFVVAKKV